MYKVYLDDKLLYYPGDFEYRIVNPVLDLALNDSGTFEFGLPPENYLYDEIYNRKSMVKILKNDVEIFYGEVRESEKDIDKIKQVYCVGELAFLFDTIQPQGKYQNYTVRQFLGKLLHNHNNQVEERKQFKLGIVTVTDNNDSIYRFTNYETTLDAIREKLCESLNGYLKIRKENGERYLDFLTLDDYGKKCNQTVEFGVNLLDYAENLSASDIATAVIPLGAKLDESVIEGLESYVDIKSVNGGCDYLYIPEAVERFGWVRVVKKFEDVTLPSNLLTKGQNWLKSAQYESVILDVNAIDLSITDETLDSIDLGDKVHSLATPFGMDTWFPVQKLNIPLQHPENQTLQLGNTSTKSYTDQASNADKNTNVKLEEIKQEQNGMQSAIDNATQMILGSKGGYKISEYDENNLWLRDLYMDAPNKDDAVNILQISNNGIGFSRNGYNGPYTNAWTIDGQLVASFISTGIISGKQNTNVYFDLDNGVISGSRLVDPTSTVIAEIAQRLYDGDYYRGFILYDKKNSSLDSVPIGGISRSWYSTDTDTPAVTFYGNDNVYFQSHGNGNRNNVLAMEKSNGVGIIHMARAIGESEAPAATQETILNVGESYLQLQKYIGQIDTMGYLQFGKAGTYIGFQTLLSGTPQTKQNFILINPPSKSSSEYSTIDFVISGAQRCQITKSGFTQGGVNLIEKINELETRILKLENK